MKNSFIKTLLLVCFMLLQFQEQDLMAQNLDSLIGISDFRKYEQEHIEPWLNMYASFKKIPNKAFWHIWYKESMKTLSNKDIALMDSPLIYSYDRLNCFYNLKENTPQEIKMLSFFKPKQTFLIIEKSEKENGVLLLNPKAIITNTGSFFLYEKYKHEWIKLYHEINQYEMILQKVRMIDKIPYQLDGSTQHYLITIIGENKINCFSLIVIDKLFKDF